MNNKNYTFSTLNELAQIIDEILPLLKYRIILLKGNLGAGKTAFTKLFGNKIGIKEEITSPTYSLVNNYSIQQKIVMYHLDLYRLNDLEEAYDLGIIEYLNSGNWCIIEWPEIFQEEIVENYHEICIFNDSNVRTLSLKI